MKKMTSWFTSHKTNAGDSLKSFYCPQIHCFVKLSKGTTVSVSTDCSLVIVGDFLSRMIISDLLMFASMMSMSNIISTACSEQFKEGSINTL